MGKEQRNKTPQKVGGHGSISTQKREKRFSAFAHLKLKKSWVLAQSLTPTLSTEARSFILSSWDK